MGNEYTINIDTTDKAKALIEDLLCCPDDFSYRTKKGIVHIKFKKVVKTMVWEDIHRWLCVRVKDAV